MKSLRLEIQLAPVMQLYIVASTEEKGKMSGLCGNYNDIQKDDFITELGLPEDTSTTFVNLWKKTQYNCKDLENTFDNPCSMHSETETIAKDWCSRLTNPNGVFSPCHSEICPKIYYDWCVYDTCKCSDIKKCMCAAVSTYAHACAAKGVILQGWMDSEPCDTILKCPENMKYSYGVTSCGSTCRSLSVHDNTCQGSFTPVDGCVCPKGTYLNEAGSCVHADQCPCYYGDKVIEPSGIIYNNGVKCASFLLLIHLPVVLDCVAPMVFFNCSKYKQGHKGVECQRTCEKQDPNNCVSTGCESGCMCPDGLLADGEGGCVERENCNCTHNGDTYSPGVQVKRDCNNCTCTNGMWTCTKKLCYGTCTVYGEGHFKTFDGKRYSFHRDYEQILAHDDCNMDHTPTFRLVTENKLCETTRTMCKSISLFFGINEIHFSEDGVKIIKNNDTDYEYQIYSAGIYIVTEVKGLFNLIWDNKTSVMLQLHPKLKRKVCGLCGNFDGNANTDFMKRNGEVVTDSEEFGNSWKVDPNFPDVTNVIDLCAEHSHRSVWAERRCSIITNDVFKDCHSLVDPNQYYEDCKKDTCACDSGGDCDCFCTAVEAYAAECRKKGACVAWRSPRICPLFCDYYNPKGKCEWHYQTCGPEHCQKTCKNPLGTCSDQIPRLEGCFPQCPPDTPYLLDETMTCVKQCNCTYNHDTFPAGSIVYHISHENDTCFKQAVCQENGENPNSTTTTVTSPSTTTTVPTTTTTIPTTTTVTPPSTTTGTSTGTSTTTTVSTTTPTIPTTTTTVTPPSTTTGTSTVTSTTTTVSTTTPTIPTTTTTVTPPSTTRGTSTVTSTTTTESTTTPTIPTSTSTVTPPPLCPWPVQWPGGQWSEWFDNSKPRTEIKGQEIESIRDLWKQGKISCERPYKIECMTNYDGQNFTGENWEHDQVVSCNTSYGLFCSNKENSYEVCHNHLIRVLCCNITTTTIPTTTTTVTTTTPTIPTSTTTVTPPSTTTGTSTVTSTTTTVSTTTPTIPTTTTTVTPPSTTTGTSTVTSTTTTESTTTPTIPTSTSTVTPPPFITTTTIPTTTTTVTTTTPTIPTSTTTVTPPSTTTGTSTVTSTTTTVSTTTPTIPTTTTTVTPPSTTTGTSTVTSTTTTESTTTPTIPTSTSTVTPPPLCPCITTTTIPTTTTTVTTTTPTIPTSTTTVTPPSTTTGTSTVTSTTTTVSTTTPTIPTTTTTVTPPSTTTGTSTVTSTTTTESTTTPTIPTSTSTVTPPPLCPWPVQWPGGQWSEWFDNSKPRTEIKGQEIESIRELWKQGKISCERPYKIECMTNYDGQNFTGENWEHDQVVSCNTSYGLFCSNKENSYEVCHNHLIRVLCCNITTTTIPTTTTTVTTTTPTIPTSTTTVTPPSTTTGTSTVTSTTTTVSTTTPTIPTTTTTVTPPSTTTGTSTVTSTTTTESTTTPTIPTSTSTVTPPPLTTTTIPTTTTTVTTTTPTIPTSTTTVTPPSTTTGTSTVTSTTTTVSTTTPTIPTTTTTVTPPSTTTGGQWSEWFDNSKPRTEIKGQEIESIRELWKQGKISCERPYKIECMTNYDGQNFTGENWEHDQVVSCNTSYGLFCSNKENSYEVCHNHLIRVLCCNITTTTIPTTTTTVTTTTPTIPTSTTTVTPPSTTTGTSTVTSTTTTVSTTTPTIPTTTTTVTPPSTTTGTSTVTSTTTTESTTTPTIPTSTSTVTPPPLCPWPVQWPGGQCITTTTIPTTTTTVTTTTPTIPTSTTTVTPPSTTTITTTTIPTTTTTVTTTTPTIPTTTTTVTPPSTTTGTSTVTSTTTTVSTTTPTIPTTTTTVTPPSTTTGTFTVTSTTTTVPVQWPGGQWSEWFDNSKPRTEIKGQEIESIRDLWKQGKISCERPYKIECMTNYDGQNFTGENWEHDQVVSCNTSYGLFCSNKENSYEVCHNHLIRVLCCNITTTTIPTTTTTVTTTTPTIPTTTTTVTPPSTTTVSTTTPTIPTSTTTVTPPSTTTGTSTVTSTTTTLSTTTSTIPTSTTTVTPPSTTTGTSTVTSTTTTVSTTTPTIPTSTTTVTPPSTTTGTSTVTSTTTTVSTTTPTIPTSTTTVTPPPTTTGTSTVTSTTTTVSTTTPTIPTSTTTVTPPSTTTGTSTVTSTTTTVSTTTTTKPTECYCTYSNVKYPAEQTDACTIKTCKDGKIVQEPVRCDPVIPNKEC
ncbi:hypothetical protein PO909_021818 [Leuciscus waleckii]